MMQFLAPLARLLRRPTDAATPTSATPSPDPRREALLKEYGEVSANFRALTDIRFRLLMLLPLSAGATAAFGSSQSGPVNIVLASFGLLATIGLATYNSRNDQLYDELVGRAAAIERIVGLPDGAFAHRPRAWLTLRDFGVRWKVDHRKAVALIYSTTIGVWLTLLLVSVIEMCRKLYMSRVPPKSDWYLEVPDPLALVQLVSVVVAAVVTYSGTIRIQKQVEKRRQLLRVLARRAVKSMQAIATDFPATQIDTRTITHCASLSEGGRATLRAERKIRLRVRFYARLSPSDLQRYMPSSPAADRAAHLVALLTDYPPRWLLDCFTGRRV
ncbi:hypothetical protein LJR175_008409 [Variovorax sp. LjRoot175]|uniref:hypothetical protein n=1 Tax=Variovorax sp. LjRoot175 TaxID=3342276 RepID=UPI003ECE6693